MTKAISYGFAVALLATAVNAAELKPETVAAWNEYVQNADARMQERTQPGHSFLWLDERADRPGQARAGEILVAPMAPRMPQQVPFGLFHHWIGAAFFPGVRLDDVSAVLNDYPRYAKYYGPHVLDARLIRQGTSEDQFSMLVMNKAFLSKTALSGDYESAYFQVDGRRRYSILKVKNLQEIEDYGRSDQHKLPDGQGTGYIWRVHVITRLEQRDGGVYIEVEAMALSRDIPGSLRWLVDPVVRRVSKSSLITSITQTHQALASGESLTPSPIVTQNTNAPRGAGSTQRR